MIRKDTGDHKSTVYSKIICNILFTSFFFFYLYISQAEIVGLSQHLFSGRTASYNPLIGSIVITLLLIIVQWQGNRVWKLHGRFFAASYLPSCLVLMMIITVCEEKIGISSYPVWNWIWIFPISTVVFGICAAALRNYDLPSNSKGEKVSRLSMLWSNTMIFVLLTCMVGASTHSTDALRYTLAAEKEIKNDNYAKALEVGRRSLIASRPLTALRAYALSKENRLGESLFEYPQYYKSDGLLLHRNDTMQMTLPPDTILHYLGINQKLGASPQELLEQLSELPHNTPQATEYLLCMWLLDKQLDRFIDGVKLHYINEENKLATPLPKHYREAISIYNELSDTPLVIEQDTMMEVSFEEFKQLNKMYPNNIELNNRARRKFGNTYYYYWFFQQ